MKALGSTGTLRANPISPVKMMTMMMMTIAVREKRRWIGDQEVDGENDRSAGKERHTGTGDRQEHTGTSTML